MSLEEGWKPLAVQRIIRIRIGSAIRKGGAAARRATREEQMTTRRKRSGRCSHNPKSVPRMRRRAELLACPSPAISYEEEILILCHLGGAGHPLSYTFIKIVLNSN